MGEHRDKMEKKMCEHRKNMENNIDEIRNRWKRR